MKTSLPNIASTESTGVSLTTSKVRTQHTHGAHDRKKPVTYILFTAIIIALALSNIILLGERFMYLPPIPPERMLMLKSGMSEKEVVDILGIPSERKNYDQVSVWYYGSWTLWNFFQIEFSQDGKVISYSMRS
jgi:hypothetical protein